MLPARRAPTHPGIYLSEDFLKPLGKTAAQLAKELRWSEIKLTEFIEGKENLSEKMCEELAGALGTTAIFWMRLQQLHKDWHEIRLQNEKGSLKPWKKAQ
jgi:antitoxin HigA-1